MKNLIENSLALYGKKGQQWLDALPQFLANKEKELNIRFQSPYPNLSYHYVAKASDAFGQLYVFKCAIPSAEMQNEIEALQLYQGQGSILLYNYNVKEGWLLLECCLPGTPLSEIKNDDQQMEIAASIMQKLWCAPKNTTSFKDIAAWTRSLNRKNNTSIIPDKMLANARTMAKDLIASQINLILLHGDLHQDNILKANRQAWLCIDPKGLLGEREYEIGALLRNPPSIVNHPNFAQLTCRRVAILSELLALEPQRILAWAFVQAVLSACWFIEDKTLGAKHALHCAEIFYRLRST